MPANFPPGSRYFERNGVPYVQTDEGGGEHRVYNCAFDPPKKMDNFQRLQDWEEISPDVFERLRAAFLEANERAPKPAISPPSQFSR